MPNTVFQLRRNTVSGTRPTTTTVSTGELAINTADGILFSANTTAIFEVGANNTNIRVTGNATINAIVANTLSVTGNATFSNTLVIDGANNRVGVGTATPGSALDVNGGIRARGGTPGSAGANNNGYAFSSPGDSDSGMFSSADGSLEFYSNNVERMKIASGGNVSINQAPGKYTIDVSGGTTTIANNGTVAFESASGMLIVNDNSGGGVTIYLCGGASVTVVSSVVGQVGTLAFDNVGTRYIWTNNSGSTRNYGFCFIRTRDFA